MDNENAAVYTEENSSITSPTSSKASKPARKKVTVKKSSAKKISKKTVKKVNKAPAQKAAKKATKTGKRYSPELKAEVVKFVHDNQSRGIMGKAMAKYKISYISLRNWLKASGGVGKKASVGAVKVKGKRGRPKGSGKKSSAVAKLGKVVGDDFDKIVAQIQEKRKELKQLMSSLGGVIF